MAWPQQRVWSSWLTPGCPIQTHDGRRDKFPKAQYRVTNWSNYNEGLRRRGDLTVWVAADGAQNLAAHRRKSPGGQARYSDLAIKICLTVRVVFRLALRKTQGFMRSIARLMCLDLVVPNFSTLLGVGPSTAESAHTIQRGTLSSSSTRDAQVPRVVSVEAQGPRLSLWGKVEAGEPRPSLRQSDCPWSNSRSGRYRIAGVSARDRDGPHDTISVGPQRS